MKHYLLTLTILILLFTGCSKKSTDNPSPSTNNNGNSNNLSNNTTIDTNSNGIFYSFRGISYKMNKGCGGEGTQSGDYGFSIAFNDCGTGITHKNYFTSENFDLMMLRDSSSMIKMLNKSYKQYNGYFFDQKYKDRYYNNGNRCDTLNLELSLSNSDILYKTFDCSSKDTIKVNSPHSFTITSAVFKSHTYYTTTLLLSGKFNLMVVNDKNASDLQNVVGHFKNLEYTFDRK